MPKHTQERYPNFLGAARRLKGWRYKQVARKLFVTVKTVALWEHGAIMPGGINLITLCLLYGRRFEQLYPTLVDQLQEEINQKK